MKKWLVLILAIITIISAVNILNAWMGMTRRGEEGLVNGFDGSYGPAVPTPPIGPELEMWAWRLRAPGTTPTPSYGGNISVDIYAPIPVAFQGIDGVKIWWNYPGSVAADGTYNLGQYVYLTHTAFENVGCIYPYPSPTGTITPNYLEYTPSNATVTSQNWSCYDYVVFYVYMNAAVNNCPEAVYQRMSLFDGMVTYTSDAQYIPCNGTGPAASQRMWKHYVSLSLNYLRNQMVSDKQPTPTYYRFNTETIKGFMINSPDFNRTAMWVTSNTIAMYYDYVTLGAQAPNDPPSVVNGAVNTTAGYDRGIITWTGVGQTGASPVTAYHIYRSIDGGAYYSAGYTSNGTFSFVQDGNTLTGAAAGNFCFKILAADNGPGDYAFTGDPFTNTINVSYNEALLERATEVCVTLNPKPTNTPTYTPTVDITITGTPATATPTSTFTPEPTSTPGGDPFANPWIYPNPFNPTAGSKTFYVGNVPAGTKVRIYSMDGSLVYDGVCDTCMVTGTNVGSVPFKWDGKNKNGQVVVSGLYYLVLTSNDETTVKRIIVCYKCDPIYKKP